MVNMRDPLPKEYLDRKSGELKLERCMAIQSTIERLESISYEEWCNYIKKKSDQTLYN